MSRTGESQDPGDQLAGLVHGLWRAVIKAARSSAQLPTLSEPHVAAVRKLLALGPLTPAQLAIELHLARPTVSNMLRELTSMGLVERRPSEADRRSVLLVPTDRARNVLASFTQGRTEVMQRALAGLPAEDADALVAALPSLSLLLERLDAMAGADAGERRRT